MKIVDGLYGFMWESMEANNCNTYLIDGPPRVLIDPGHLHLFGHVESQLRQLGLKLEDIDLVVATHAHPDHVEAVRAFKGTGALFAVHEDDWQLMKEMGAYLGASFDMDAYAPSFFLGEGDLEVKGLRFRVFHTPGHSPGSISLLWEKERALFTGDVIFRDGLGRTDLPGGDGEVLKKSIRNLADLDVEWLLPGHGGAVAGAARVRANFGRVEEFWFRYI